MPYDFKTQIKEAHQVEEFVCDRLAKYKPGSTATRHTTPYEHDIDWFRPSALGGTYLVKVEVKNDKKTFQTHNVALEDKAILGSNSDFIVYVLDGLNLCLLIDTDRAKELIPKYRAVRGGEFNEQIRLIPERDFISQAIII